jgi:uncharacterized protein YjiK
MAAPPNGSLAWRLAAISVRLVGTLTALGPPLVGQALDTTISALRRYDLERRPDWQAKLAPRLQEISGLAFSAAGRLYGHGDEDGTIWELDPKSGKVLKSFALAPIEHQPFMGKRPRPGEVTGDFEDIQIIGDRFFLVSSNGVLVEFREGGDGQRVPFRYDDTGLAKTCEIEGLSFDSPTGALLLLCKEVYRRRWRGSIAVMAWSLERRQLEPEPRWLIPYSALPKRTESATFLGSAMAVAPGGASVIVIAGPERAFLEVARNGTIVSAGRLSRKAHRKPESLAFGPDGTILIADEGDGRTPPLLAGYHRRDQIGPPKPRPP